MIKHPRGDTFSYSGTLTPRVNGDVQLDLTGWTGRSMIRTLQGVLIEELTFTWLDASQAICNVRSANSTDSWPIGKAKIDMQITSPGGFIASTPATVMEITGDVTYD